MVADEWVEVGDDADGVFHVFAAYVRVGGDPVDAFFPEGGGGVAEDFDGFEEGLADGGFHHVELELAGFGGHEDGEVVAEDFEAYLVDDFGDDRVDFGRHDGGSGLSFG